MSSPSKSPRTSGARRTSRSAAPTAPQKRVAADTAIDRDLAALAMDLALDLDADLDLDLFDVPRATEGSCGAAPGEAELSTRLTAHLAKARARVVVTDNLHTMVSIKRGHGVLTFRVHHMFLGSPPAIVRALARYAEQQDRASARLLRSFIDANEAQIRRRCQPRPLPCDVEGRHHHLQEIFDDLNARYFQGAIAARITWGPRTRRRRRRGSIKLGSYTCEDALIRIHPVLDARDVPRFFVEWIVYHEMLHEIYDMPVIDGRRVYHTPEFRRAEARFDRYAEAVLWERTNLHKLLER